MHIILQSKILEVMPMPTNVTRQIRPLANPHTIDWLKRL